MVKSVYGRVKRFVHNKVGHKGKRKRRIKKERKEQEEKEKKKR